MEPEFPIEIVVEGNPRSSQARAAGLSAWKSQLGGVLRGALSEPVFLSAQPLRFTFYWFADAEAPGDLDNMLKPVLDAAVGVVMLDDQQVQSISAEFYPPSRPIDFTDPSPRLVDALERARPFIYIRFEERD